MWFKFAAEDGYDDNNDDDGKKENDDDVGIDAQRRRRENDEKRERNAQIATMCQFIPFDSSGSGVRK